MGMVEYRVNINMGSIKRLEKALRSNSGEISKAYEKWSKIYAIFTRKRFRRLMKGGRGGWRKLQQDTVDAKRRGGYRHPLWILYRTGKMLKVLNPRFLKRTAKSHKLKNGLVVTYGGRQRYRGGPLVSKVMGWHDKGAGNLPKRRIFIAPDRDTRNKMVDIMETAMQKVLDK